MVVTKSVRKLSWTGGAVPPHLQMKEDSSLSFFYIHPKGGIFMDDLEKIYYSEVRLKKMSVSLQQSVSAHILDPRLDFDVVGAMADHFVARLTGYVWSAEDETVVAQYPASTWQMFKRDWFPRPLLKRFPIKYTKIVCKADAMFPTLRIMVPDHEAVLRLTLLESPVDKD